MVKNKLTRADMIREFQPGLDKLFGFTPEGYDGPFTGPNKPNKRLAGEEKKKAIDAVARAAKDWQSSAMPVLRQISRTVEEFTTDRVQWELDRRGIEPPREPRAYGALMRKAAREGLMEKTDRAVPSVYPRNHRRPKAVWRSKVCVVKAKQGEDV